MGLRQANSWTEFDARVLGSHKLQAACFNLAKKLEVRDCCASFHHQAPAPSRPLPLSEFFLVLFVLVSDQSRRVSRPNSWS